jgi:uncharacterized membrane protein
MPLALGVVKFKGENRAFEVLDDYSELHPSEAWPNQASIITRRRFGRIELHHNIGMAWDDADNARAAGLGIGGMTGMLVGAIAGAPGMAAGAAIGSALGALIGAGNESEKPLYKLVRSKMEKDTSAILLLADAQIVDRMLKEFGPQGVDTIHRAVSDELSGNLSEAVQQAARQQPQVAPEGTEPTHAP